MFQLRGRSGRWGFGEIYEAVHKETGEIRMLKIVRGRRSRDPYIKAHLSQELNVSRKVNHPNIMRVESLEEDPSLGVFIVMPPVAGETLSSLLKKGVTFTASTATKLFMGIGKGLSAVHAQGLIHGELNIDTVFIQDRGKGPEPLLTGFGLPPGYSIEGTKKTVSLPLEAMPYASPERRLGRYWDFGSDVYSTCAILAHVLLGQPPPPRGWRGPPPFPKEAPKETLDFIEIVSTGMSIDPESRFPSMDEFLRAVALLSGGKANTPAKKGVTNPRGVPLPLNGPKRALGKAVTSTGLGQVPPVLTKQNRIPPAPPPLGKSMKKTPPMPTPSPRRPRGTMKKTVLGIGAVGAGANQSPGGRTPQPALPSKSLKKTAVGSGKKAPPLTKPVSVKSLVESSPPRAAFERSGEERIEMVSSEAAKDDAGIVPLEPEVFGGQTGSLPTVDPKADLSVEMSKPVKAKKRNWWLLIGIIVFFIGGLTAAAVIFRPWRWGASEEQGKTQKELSKKNNGDGDPIAKKSQDATMVNKKQEDGSVEKDSSVVVDADKVPDAEHPKSMEPDAGSEEEIDAAMEEEQSASSTQRYRLYLKQGHRAMRHHRYELARRQFTRAMKIRPSSQRARLYMGQAHYRAREYWAAVHWFKKALRVRSRSATTHLLLGRAFIKVNKKGQACKHFLRAFKIRPNSKIYRRYVENYRCH